MLSGKLRRIFIEWGRSMKRELFKELNSHIRACDNKGLVINTSYLGALLFFYSESSMNVIGKKLLDEKLISLETFNISRLAAILAFGYGVLLIQVWYRGWKVHYIQLLHEIWKKNREELGDDVPYWMKNSTTVMSFDNLIRLFPFIVNFIIVLQIAFLYRPVFGWFFVGFALGGEALNLGACKMILAFGENVKNRLA